MTVEARSVRDPAPRTMPGRGDYWVQPAVVAVGFTLFIIYSFWSVGLAPGHGWRIGPYLSPYYSPRIPIAIWPFSSAFLVAWVPLAFRATCYYYRKAYYRAYFLDPAACAIREPSHPHVFSSRYTGERRLPWILNNFHRYALYLALIVLIVLWWDTIHAFWNNGGIYVGFGSLLMLANVVLLTCYTFSCHALRHLVGGSVNCFSCARAGHMRHGLWGAVTSINPYHGFFAWASLISVGLTDIYIRFAASGALGCTFSGHFGC